MRQAHVLADGAAQHQALLLAGLGDHGHALGDGLAGRAELAPLAVEFDAAAVDGVGAEDGAHDLGATGAHEPGHDHDLAGTDLEGDVLEDACAREPIDLEDGGGVGAMERLGGKVDSRVRPIMPSMQLS